MYKRKHGIAIKFWQLPAAFNPWYQYAERDDGKIFLRYREAGNSRRWEPWAVGKDPRRKDGRIRAGKGFPNLELRILNLGRVRLPKSGRRERKTGLAVKLWKMPPNYTGLYQYAEREDGTLFFRSLESLMARRWGKWGKSRKDPREGEGRKIKFGREWLRLFTEDLGRFRLPK